eukprot:scaffold21389_cov62-Phaeocystis_antarctica.AAC.1
MPTSWNKRGHDKRPDYCRIEYSFTEHNGDWEAAYQEFATFDSRAPEVCRDDFRDLIFFEEGEEVEDGGEKAATTRARPSHPTTTLAGPPRLPFSSLKHARVN